MKPSVLLKVSSAYLTIVGLGLFIVPDVMVLGSLGAGVSAGLVSSLRGYGGALLGIAVINWMSQNVGPSRARESIVYGNAVGFGLVAIAAVVGLLNGASRLAWMFAIIDATFAVAFFVVARRNTSAG